MANQFTKGDEGKLSGNFSTTKWSVILSREDSDLWDLTAKRVHRDKSDLFRELLEYSAKRVEEFCKLYPDSICLGIHPCLDAYYDASKIAMTQEHHREWILMQAFEAAKLADGGKVNYAADRDAVELTLQAWKQGLTIQSVLDDFAKAKAEALAKFELAENQRFLPNDIMGEQQTEKPEVSALQDPQAQVAQARQAAPWEEMEIDWVRIVLMVFILVAVLACLGGVGYVLANVFSRFIP